MPEDRDNLIEEAVEAFHSLSHALHHSGEPILVDLDLTMAQLRTLITLMRCGPNTIGQIAEAQRITLPTASHLVERLVQAGYVERSVDPTDRRRALARLSPSGEELVIRMRQGPREQFRHILALVDREDLVALVRGIQATVSVAKREFDQGDDIARYEADVGRSAQERSRVQEPSASAPVAPR